MREVIIMRGLPGSGKSTYAKKQYPEYEYCSMDNFFIKNGEYKYDAKKIFPAVNYCKNKFQKAIEAGKNIVVDNTNLTKKEYIDYIKIANENGYDVIVYSFVGLTAKESFEFNSHGVPLEKCEQMEKKYQPFDYSIELSNKDNYICNFDVHYICPRMFRYVSFDRVMSNNGEDEINLFHNIIFSFNDDVNSVHQFKGEYVSRISSFGQELYKRIGDSFEKLDMDYYEIGNFVGDHL